MTENNFITIIKKYVKNARATKTNSQQFRSSCPFHDPKTIPGGEVDAFVFDGRERKWHCFDCGLGGDLEAFLQQIEKIYETNK